MIQITNKITRSLNITFPEKKNTMWLFCLTVYSTLLAKSPFQIYLLKSSNKVEYTVRQNKIAFFDSKNNVWASGNIICNKVICSN